MPARAGIAGMSMCDMRSQWVSEVIEVEGRE
jgi:hypothetical protein